MKYILKCDLKKEIILPQWRIMLGCVLLVIIGFIAGLLVNKGVI